MTKQISQITIAIGSLVLLLGLAACSYERSTKADARSNRSPSTKRTISVIIENPKSQNVMTNDTVFFSVGIDSKRARNAAFQWFFNGAPIDQRIAKEFGIADTDKRTLIIKRPSQKNVGLYQCAVQYGPDVVEMSESAELTLEHHSVITVYGTPIGGAGGGSDCPPQYVGYVTYRLATFPYGWRFPNGGKAEDRRRQDTVVAYFGSPLTNYGCGASNSVEIRRGTTCAYRFTIYFKNNIPSGPYPITLTIN